MTGTTGKFCPMSPTRAHRVYYSARASRETAPVGRVACCRHCAVDVYLVAGQWQSVPPGDVLVGMCLEVDRLMIEGHASFAGEPVGILNYHGRATDREVPIPRFMS